MFLSKRADVCLERKETGFSQETDILIKLSMSRWFLSARIFSHPIKHLADRGGKTQLHQFPGYSSDAPASLLEHGAGTTRRQQGATGGFYNILVQFIYLFHPIFLIFCLYSSKNKIFLYIKK